MSTSFNPPGTNLETIIAKVRALTASPDQTQLPDQLICDYINTYYLNDFPQQLRNLKLETVYELDTIPGQPIYSIPWDLYTSFGAPCYVAGYETAYYFDRTTFFRAYPNQQANLLILANGTTGPYTGNLGQTPIIPGTVYASAVNVSGTVEGYDDDALTLDPLTQEANWVTASGYINYNTGDFSITFGGTIPAGTNVSIQFTPGQPAMPQAMLQYDSFFILRPQPDQSYRILLNAFILPTQILDDEDQPQLFQWWQALAFGAAKKVFEERMDSDSLARIAPMLKEQLLYCQRSTIVELSQQIPKTPYSWQLVAGTQSANGGYNYWGL